MLKFWKKSGRKENAISSSGTSPTSSPKNQSRSLSNGDFFAESIQIEELDRLISVDAQDTRKSRLSKTLDEVIADNEALAYFIQYLETVGQGALIKFILDVQSFDTALASSGDGSRAAKISGELERVLNDIVAGDGSKSADGGRDIPSGIGCEKSESEGDVCVNGGVDLKQVEIEVFSRLSNSIDVSENVIDAVKIYAKYFSHKAPLKIGLDPRARHRLVEKLTHGVNEMTFSEAKKWVMKVLDQEHFNDFLRSEFHCKYQIDVLTSNKVFISDILYNDTALFYFMEFLEQEGCTNLVEFWIAAYHFQLQYQERDQNYDPVEAQNDAMVLYDKEDEDYEGFELMQEFLARVGLRYFSLQATNPLHLGDNIRIRVEESICTENGPMPNCFDYPQKLIVKLLETKYLQPFLQSQLYCKYLSELITTIQASPVLCSRSGNSAGSDCSSEVSISATNTLLASEDVNPPKKIFRHLNNDNMSIDTQQLYDPDSLWRRRPKRSGLNFGRVNELGRFETDLEPEPDRKSESRITKAVKKFVHLDEDKSKEEMAWQVAAMIVKDVTNITMPPSPGT